MSRKRLFRSWPDGYGALARLHRAVGGSGLEPALLELVRLRASQVNGCGPCVATHTAGARAAGHSEARIEALAQWRQAPHYSPRERAALGFTEAVTLVADDGPLEEAVAGASSAFTPGELTRLLYAVVEINAWNRLVVTAGVPDPGAGPPQPDAAPRTSGSAPGS